MSPIENLPIPPTEIISANEKNLDAIAKSLEGAVGNSSQVILERISKLKELGGKVTEGNIDSLLAEIKLQLPSYYDSTLAKIKEINAFSVTDAQKKAHEAQAALRGVYENPKAAAEKLQQAAASAGTQAAKQTETIVERAKEVGAGAVIGETISKVVNSIGDVFASIGEFFKKIFAMLAGAFGFKIPELLGKKETAEDVAKKKAEEIAKTGTAAKEDLEKKFAELPKEIKEKLKIDLKQWGFSDNDKKKSSAFNEVWNEFAPEIERLVETNKGALLDNTKHNPIDTFLRSISLPPRMFLSLVSKGVIPISAITTQVYDGAVVLSLRSLQGMLRFGNDQMEGAFARMSLQHFDKEKAKISPEELAILNQLYVHTHVVGAYILSVAGATVAKIGSLTFAWNESVGINGLMANYRAVMGDWAKSSEQMKNIATSIGSVKDLEQIGTLERNMLNVFQEQVTKGYVTDAFTRAKNPADFLTKMHEIERLGSSADSLVDKKIIEEMSEKVFGSKTLPQSLPADVTMQKLSDPLRRKLAETSIQVRDLWKFDSMLDRAKAGFSRVPETGAHYIDNIQNDLARTNKYMSLAVEYKAEGKGLGLIFEKIKQVVSPSAFSEIAKNAQKGIVSVQLADAQSVGKAISNLSQEAPGAVSAFFKMFPLVVVAGTTAVSEDKVSALKSGLIGLTPIIGPIYLIHEGWEMEGLKFMNVSLIGLGTTQLAIEGAMLMNILRHPDRISKLGAFMGRPVTMTVQAIQGMNQIGSLTKQTVSTIARGGGKNLIKGAFSNSSKVGMAIGAMAAAVAVIVYGPEKLLNELEGRQSANFLAENGYLNPDGSINLAILKEKFSVLSQSDKKKVVEYIALSSFGSDYSIDTSKGIDIKVHGAVPLEVISAVKTDLASVLGNEESISVGLSDDGLKTWYEYLKKTSNNDVYAIKDSLITTLGISAEELGKKIPELFNA